jgi:hypothetical protein
MVCTVYADFYVSIGILAFQQRRGLLQISRAPISFYLTAPDLPETPL